MYTTFSAQTLIQTQAMHKRSGDLFQYANSHAGLYKGPIPAFDDDSVDAFRRSAHDGEHFEYLDAVNGGRVVRQCNFKLSHAAQLR
ncbi:hypothetical protein ASE49_15980 [Novosphingobium sp. Leaf2]|nr:hypothetical protein ASE49_15980 [Novosphingobium sp. Leaf2]